MADWGLDSTMGKMSHPEVKNPLKRTDFINGGRIACNVQDMEILMEEVQTGPFINDGYYLVAKLPQGK